jgi:type I restriction enzyme M protein
VARTRRTAKDAAPVTTAQRLGSLIKSARDILRKDKGLNGDLDRLPLLTWVMFLKFLDDTERQREEEAALAGERFRPIILPPYRWRDWAAKPDGVTGPELIGFIALDDVQLDPKARGPGLFAYLRKDAGSDVVNEVFRGVTNRMESGYLLRDILNLVNEIHFTATDEIHTLSALYESLLKEMRDAAGDSGEHYTPRPVVRFMVDVTDPKLGETVLDPASGTAGFLVESYQHLFRQCKTVKDRRTLQKSIIGGEAKSLPYLLALMNLMLHGIEAPQIKHANSLAVKVGEIGDKDRVDIVLTNPPFGGEEERSILDGFPADKRTAETALLFLQLIMRKLRRPIGGRKPGRAGVVVPNGTLFGDGVCARIKEDLLTQFNLHTVIRLPNGVFAPYTSIPTNLLFFDRSGPTADIWYYELPPPEGRKQYTKTAPLQVEDFADCKSWWADRKETERAWKVPFADDLAVAKARAQPHYDEAARLDDEAKAAAKEAADAADALGLLNGDEQSGKGMKARRKALETEHDEWLATEKQAREGAREARARGDAEYWPVFNLDRKNPNAPADLEHLPPEQLVADILAKERRILAIVEEVQTLLAEGHA